ncbi:OmpA family protein [Emticicia sp. 21SJ11W-3]|uniref:OmpA family protein n=1 Tax=Emticicia sp. 21SJ11W-3 TaxID=2916755 RepID=UPI00209E3F67|nr:OmpA family protein [Emticicia sp. 21SJ11W-3]UTA69183.1 OmpA family protein [Emticicia sp. 21SJ11W-3]
MKRNLISKSIVLASALMLVGYTNMSCKSSNSVTKSNSKDNNKVANMPPANAEKATITTVSMGGANGDELKRIMADYVPAMNENLMGIASVEAYDEGLLVTMTKGNIFKVDSYMINENAKQDLLRIAYSLKQIPNTFVLVGGHADATGKNAYNEKLSRKRAVQVANYLRSAGVEENRLLVDGFGEKVPVRSNKYLAGRNKNRRVDFLIVADNSIRESVVNNTGGR